MRRLFMKRRVFALLLVVVMMGTLFVGCGSSNEDEVDNAKNQPGDTATNGNEVATLKWIMVGNGMPSNYKEWQENINAYLEEKIGVNVDVEVVSWGDWDNRRNVIINSGEYFDILFTDFGRYLSEVNLGAYYDITDLVKIVLLIYMNTFPRIIGKL